MTHRADDGLPAPRFPRLKGRLPPRLLRCIGCSRHHFAAARTCPHCGADVVALQLEQVRALKRAKAALAKLKKLFG